MIAIARFMNNRISSAELIPLNVNNKEVLFQSRPLTDERASAVIQDIQEISNGLQQDFMLLVKDGKGFISLNKGISSASLP
ncbi:MAG: hypothetical protein A2067_01100 [Deltaproteobacteria bacterium GWB2_42_7]|nr:MAG: hypothetical protein A2067_01100 [Deltaproteobacteria bacterium GWB2_42_7]